MKYIALLIIVQYQLSLVFFCTLQRLQVHNQASPADSSTQTSPRGPLIHQAMEVGMCHTANCQQADIRWHDTKGTRKAAP
uniref:Secreted protein n=1 Tax=Setaria italica TaxID=4555 RepID=K4A3X4_SETIT